MLDVSKVEASLRFYVDQLGFTVPWRYEEAGRARVAQVDCPESANEIFPRPSGPRVNAKDTRFASNQSVQVRLELLNLTNTAKFNGASAGTAVDLSSFGRITSQRGFMRIWQLSFRYAF